MRSGVARARSRVQRPRVCRPSGIGGLLRIRPGAASEPDPDASAGCPAIPPGRNSTTRMNSVPRMNSGSRERHPQHRRQARDEVGARERREPLVEQRVDDTADDRAPARPHPAEHDDHEEREREVGGAIARATRPTAAAGSPSRRPRRAPRRRRRRASLTRNGRMPMTRTRNSFSRVAAATCPRGCVSNQSTDEVDEHEHAEREPVEVARVRARRRGSRAPWSVVETRAPRRRR